MTEVVREAPLVLRPYCTFLLYLRTCFSNFLGNSFVYFQFNDPEMPINRPMRLRITLILLAFVFLSVIMMCFLRPPIRNDEDERKIRNPLNEIGKAFKILVNRTGFLCLMFIYLGERPRSAPMSRFRISFFIRNGFLYYRSSSLVFECIRSEHGVFKIFISELQKIRSSVRIYSRNWTFRG